MNTHTFTEEDEDREKKEIVYKFLAWWSVLLGVLCILSMLGSGTKAWMVAFGAYTMATALRLVAGAVMNRMGDAATVNAWNNKYHRLVVIVLNSVVGAALLGRLAWDTFTHRTHIGPFAFLISAFIAYFIAARFTRPNTFGARVRSATLTIVLLCTLAQLTHPAPVVWLLTGALLFNGAWLNLARLQRRLGWENR